MSEEQTPEYRVSQALLWLGFEDVEIGKKFSSEKFQNQEKEVLVPEITYTTKDNLIPKSVAGQLIKFMDNVLLYHQQLEEKRKQLSLEQKEKELIERENKLKEKEAQLAQLESEQKGEDNE